MRKEEIWKRLRECKTIGDIVKQSCGEKIGSGVYRDVYILKDNDRYVVKVEKDMSGGHFINVREWSNYRENRFYEKLVQWMAPCHFIDETGRILIQSRVERLIDNGKMKKDFPKKIPHCFMDLHYHNFGWIGKRFVCFDYPVLKTDLPYKLVTAKWRDHSK